MRWRRQRARGGGWAEAGIRRAGRLAMAVVAAVLAGPGCREAARQQPVPAGRGTTLPMTVEARKVTPPATRPAATRAAPAEGRLIFEEDFSRGLANWQPEGPNLVEVVDGRLHVKTTMAAKSGQFVWLRRDLPADFRVEYDLTPVSSSGFFLIFFCARGVNGEDILGGKLFKQYRQLRDFKKYTIGPINCYHISYRRNRMANCNLRKNTGKHLLKQSRIDMVLPAGKTAHVALTKSGGRIRLVVNGKVFVDCTDDGSINGGVYGRGKTGLRQVYDSEGYYDNFKVFDLTAGP